MRNKNYKTIVITEGFKIIVNNSLKAIMLYFLVPFITFGISNNIGVTIYYNILFSLLSIILLNLFITEKTIISNYQIKHFNLFLIFTKKVDIESVTIINIDKPIIPSTTHNYIITVKGDKVIKFGFLSNKSLKTFITAIQQQQINIEIANNILIELE